MFSSDLLKKFIELPTPFYFYDTDILRENLKSLSNCLKTNNKVFFSVKSNTNPKILNIISDHKLGIDAVSFNEIKHCLRNGFIADDIVFAGVGKTDKEIEDGIKSNISCFNVESFQELDLINKLSKKQSKKTNVSIRINPNITSDTNKKIQTGSNEDKFGIDIKDINHIPELSKLSNIDITGIHFHIGSQLLDLKPFKKLCVITNDITSHLKENGVKLRNINVGGGLGIDYDDPINNPISNFNERFSPL